MFTNKQSLVLSAAVGLGFFIAGIFRLLDNLIVQIILGSVFILIILNLFMIEKDENDNSEVDIKEKNLHKK